MSGNDGIASDQGGRRDRLIKEQIHDPYVNRSKPKEPAVCPDCGVVAQGGRWQWLEPRPDNANEHVCPACQRVRDRVPAGILMLGGAFFAERRKEIMRLVKNKVEAERAERPLKRIMDINETDEGVEIRFTDSHLPRGVGEAVASAYEGELEVQYPEEAGLIRAYWQRN